MEEEGGILKHFRAVSRAEGLGLKHHTVFLVLFLLSFLIRFPFFFRDYIDRDESTFILVAQAWVEGHLPYTQLWDLKPPIIYGFFSLILLLFGKSFIAIRMAGVLAVACTAFFTYRIGAQLGGKRTAIWAGIFCVYLQSLFGSLQGVMSEHICMLFFMPALFLLSGRKSKWRVFTAGLLLGLAIMTKLNMAFPGLMLGLFLLLEGFREQRGLKIMQYPLIYGGGILLLILLTLLPYAFQGESLLWWRSVVLAPLEYTGARRFSILKLAPVWVLAALFFFLSYKRKWLNFKKAEIQILSLAVFGVVLSYVQGGRVNGHYLIQLHPMGIILVGTALSRIKMPVRSSLLPLLLVLLPGESYKEYYDLALYRINRGSWYNGEGFTVPAYLQTEGLGNKSVLYLEYHIGYWVSGRFPPVKSATHPSNICRDELYPFYNNPRANSMAELRYIMDTLRPQIVITRENRLIFDQDEVEENEYVSAYLERHYSLLEVVDKAVIHKRSE